MLKNSIQSLGSLEEEVMQIIWKEKNVSVRFIFDKIKIKRPIAYTTVMTIMSRLHTKGILNRRQQDGAYIYSPAQSKEKFLEKISEKIIFVVLWLFCFLFIYIK